MRQNETFKKTGIGKSAANSIRNFANNFHFPGYLIHDAADDAGGDFLRRVYNDL